MGVGSGGGGGGGERGRGWSWVGVGGGVGVGWGWGLNNSKRAVGRITTVLSRPAAGPLTSTSPWGWPPSPRPPTPPPVSRPPPPKDTPCPQESMHSYPAPLHKHTPKTSSSPPLYLQPHPGRWLPPVRAPAPPRPPLSIKPGKHFPCPPSTAPQENDTQPPLPLTSTSTRGWLPSARYLSLWRMSSPISRTMEEVPSLQGGGPRGFVTSAGLGVNKKCVL